MTYIISIIYNAMYFYYINISFYYSLELMRIYLENSFQKHLPRINNNKIAFYCDTKDYCLAFDCIPMAF